MPTNRIEKSATQRFTKIITDSGAFELWNSLTPEEENTVIEKLSLEKGGLPLSKKDVNLQRLLFGKGAFGKVRLAHKDGEFFAVKKISVDSDDDAESVIREYEFSKMLEGLSIPNVTFGVNKAVSVDKRGKQTVYMFLNKVATLGDGENLKKLLSYFDSKEQRDAVLLHTTYSMLQAVAMMHHHKIYHRDIKASNILVSGTGQILVSDFGAASTSNPDLIANVLHASTKEYSVSNLSDLRYYTPEVQIAVALRQPVSIDVNEQLDNWRLGLTLLQLCGVIKENYGILARKYDMTNEDGSVAPGWLEQMERKGIDVNPASIKQHFQEEIQKIKNESLEKIPTQLHEIIFGLLEVDSTKRLTSGKAFERMQQLSAPEETVVRSGFQNLVHNQIAETVKNSVKRALKQELKKMDVKELNKAIQEFKLLLKQKDTDFERLESFLSKWIPDKTNWPTITPAQLQATLSLVQQKLQSSPTSHPTKSAQPALPNAYADTGLENATHYIEPIIPSRPAPETPEIEEKEFTRLHKNFVNAAHQLLQYAKTKVSKQNEVFKEIEDQTIKSVNSIVSRIKKFLAPKPLEIKRVDTRYRGKGFDESAVKAVFARIDQIMNQFTIGKLMSLSSEELTAVYQMLEKDKDFLESIEDKLPMGWTTIEKNPLWQINGKMDLIEQLMSRNYLYVSNSKLDAEQFMDYDRQATSYRAKHKESEASFIFSKSKNMSAYKVPAVPDELFRNFVAHTMQDVKQPEELYIYTSSKTLGVALANTLASLNKNSNTKIFVNDEKMPKKSVTSTKFANFFREGRVAHISEQASHFTIEELSPFDMSLKK